MIKKDQVLPEWRRNILEKHLLTSLIALELVLSVIFFTISYVNGNIYFKGVEVGLLIAWVTGLIAHIIKVKLI